MSVPFRVQTWDFLIHDNRMLVGCAFYCMFLTFGYVYIPVEPAYNFVSHQTSHTFSSGSTQGQMISGFLEVGAAQRTALVMTF